MSVFGIVKIVLLGDYAAGKTTLKRSFMGLHLDELYMTTLGVDLASYHFVDSEFDLKYQIWDLGGQPEFKTIRIHQYAGTEGGLLVFDKGRPETFDHLTDWLDELSEAIKKVIPILLIGNKSDLVSEEKNFEYNKRAQVFIEEKQHLYPKIDLCGYFSTCAISGHNVRSAFLALGKEIIKKKSEEMVI
ncbi:MAG: GTP-binding protein [Candidatus Heimdallarchaeaceae archaeon]